MIVCAGADDRSNHCVQKHAGCGDDVSMFVTKGALLPAASLMRLPRRLFSRTAITGHKGRQAGRHQVHLAGRGSKLMVKGASTASIPVRPFIAELCYAADDLWALNSCTLWFLQPVFQLACTRARTHT